jgi:hypothetical protein
VDGRFKSYFSESCDSISELPGSLDFEAHEVSSWRNRQWKALGRLA